MTRQVLIVDDSQFVRQALAFALRADPDITVLQAKNGREALEVLANEPGVAAVVLDVDMPIINGREMLATLGTAHRGALFIVAVGSQADAPALDDCRRLGASALVSKPLDVESLCGLLRQALADADDRVGRQP